MVFVGKTGGSAPENAAQRVLRRISDHLDKHKDRPRGYRKDQRGLAKHLGMAESSLSELLDGAAKRGLLVRLDKIAEYLNVPPSMLVHRNDTNRMELREEEHRLVVLFRDLPADLQDHVLDVFGYFAGLLPEEQLDRERLKKWRRLSPKNRDRVDRVLRQAYQEDLAARQAIRSARVVPGNSDGNIGATSAPRQGETKKRAEG